MTLIMAFLSTFWKPLGAGLAIVAGLVVTYLKGRQHGGEAATQQAAVTVAQAQQATQVAETKADAAQATAVAAQASQDAMQAAKQVSTQVDQMKPEDVANELKKDWSSN
jgi:ATP:corrinoid adenosyltransferase